MVWLPYDEYVEQFKNVDKFEIILSKNLLDLNSVGNETKLTIADGVLEISETTSFHTEEDCDNVFEKVQIWKVSFDPKYLNLLKELYKDSYKNKNRNFITDVAPARLTCYFHDKKIFEGTFNELNLNYTKFLESVLKAPILRKKFKVYEYNKCYDKKKKEIKLPF